ncbi:MAG: hypothetical protein COC01_09350, partial [Bacteroidetes bacterium]
PADCSYAQSCPACSNPAIQSNEKIEAGMNALAQGAFRITFNPIAGFDYQGGHPNFRGLTPEKEIIAVPLHNHVVELSFYRIPLNLEYTFVKNWSAWLHIPYDIKVQKANVEFVEPVSLYESTAILRNRDIHHRNENYKGFSDAKFLISHRLTNVVNKKDRLDIAIGTSLPLGKTEGNPLKAADDGEKHLHIQFGTGTFNPLLELHYSAAVNNKTTLSIFTINKLPFYENKKNYRGPIETTSGLGLSYSISKQLTFRGNFSQLFMSHAFWDDVVDPNSGLFALNGMLGATHNLKNGLMISPMFRFPIYQRTLTSEGDTFKFGPTFLLNVSFLLNTKKNDTKQ